MDKGVGQFFRENAQSRFSIDASSREERSILAIS
jgi:hypothetical protein